MAYSIKNLRRKNERKPLRAMVYGVHGIGKTTFAASAPNPAILCIEDGMGDIQADHLDMVGCSYGDLLSVIGELYSEDHDHQSLVIDSLDWLEPKVWAETCSRGDGVAPWEGIESPGYGKGYAAALSVWRELFDGLNALRNERNMHIVLIAHNQIKAFNSPETPPYDRYTPKLHESGKGIGANPLLQEHVDCILFNNYRVSIVKDQGKGDKKGEGHARGVGGGQRVIYTQERPAFLAKNRYSMPASIDLPDDPAGAWAALAAHIPFFSQPAKEAA